jgi:hypothetical protein
MNQHYDEQRRALRRPQSIWKHLIAWPFEGKQATDTSLKQHWASYG